MSGYNILRILERVVGKGGMAFYFHSMYWFVFVGVILSFLIWKSFVIVPQGFHYTVEFFGRYTKTIFSGFHFLIPFIEQIGARVNVMENVLEIPSQDVITKDNAAVTVDGIVFYKIFDASKSSYQVSNLKQAITNITMTNIRTVMGGMDLDELLSNREAINARLLAVVDCATELWGTKVTRIELKDIQPPQDLVSSMSRQMKAERDKRALILTAEGERQSQILKAEGKQQSQILEADGMRAAMILRAEGRKESARRDAEARESLARAEANAALFVNQAVDGHSTSALNYFVAQKYIEAFGRLADSPNQKVVFMPMETSAMLSSLGGMSELFKNVTGDQTKS